MDLPRCCRKDWAFCWACCLVTGFATACCIKVQTRVIKTIIGLILKDFVITTCLVSSREHTLLPKGNGAGGEGALDVDKTLVAAAVEAEGDVALGLDEGTVNEDVEFAYHVHEDRVFLYLFPSVAGEAPYVIAKFLLDAVDEGASAIGLLQGVASAQGDRRLVVGDNLHQFIEGAFFPTLEVPRGRVVTAGAMVVAARQVD